MDKQARCLNCGEPIEPTRYWHRFCGKECRSKFHGEARRVGAKQLEKLAEEKSNTENH